MKKQKLKNLGEEDLQAISNVTGGLLDKQAATLASKKDIQSLTIRVDDLAERQNSLATKQDLLELKVELKDYIHQGIEAVMEGMDNLAETLAEKGKVEKLAEWAIKVGEKVGVKPKF